VVSCKTRQVKHRAATALRMGANSLCRAKGYFGEFFRRMRAKLGTARAITATAHQIAEPGIGRRSGARTAQRLGLAVSGDTLLRHLRRMSDEQKPVPVSPRVLGIDDWAWRKGQRYGTILCDLERRRVVDLLADRQVNTAAAWLRDHAPPEVISRDRAGAYAETARQGAPHAVQVADRFHLLRNLRDALERVSARHEPILVEAFRRQCPVPVTPPPVAPTTPSNPALTRSQQFGRERRQRRFERYQQVIELYQRGTSGRAIAAQLGLNRKTVRRLAARRTIS
jgi:hypothetical protein